MATSKEQIGSGSLAAKSQLPAAADKSGGDASELASLRERNAQLERENTRLQEEKATLSMASDGGGSGYRSIVGDGRTVQKGQRWPFRVTARGKDKSLEPAIVEAVDPSEAIRLFCVHEPLEGAVRVSDQGQVLAPQRNKHLDPSSFSFKAENLRQGEFEEQTKAKYLESWESRFPGDKAPSQIPRNLIPSFA